MKNLTKKKKKNLTFAIDIHSKKHLLKVFRTFIHKYTL